MAPGHRQVKDPQLLQRVTHKTVCGHYYCLLVVILCLFVVVCFGLHQVSYADCSVSGSRFFTSETFEAKFRLFSESPRGFRLQHDRLSNSRVFIDRPQPHVHLLLRPLHAEQLRQSASPGLQRYRWVRLCLFKGIHGAAVDRPALSLKPAKAFSRAGVLVFMLT